MIKQLGLWPIDIADPGSRYVYYVYVSCRGEAIYFTTFTWYLLGYYLGAIHLDDSINHMREKRSPDD